MSPAWLESMWISPLMVLAGVLLLTLLMHLARAIGRLHAMYAKALLVAPALDWHPSNETVMKYFSPQIPAERIGVGIEWKKELRIMFRS